MYEKYILCLDCKRKLPLNKPIFRCPECNGSLEVIFNYSKLKRVKKLFFPEFNHSRYLKFYPVKNIISLQEGGTPLLRSKNIEKKFQLDFELYFKYEAENPSASFKDRGSSVEIAKALEFGAKKVICASTGNMGASVAAYSAVANLECTILVPKDTLSSKIQQILDYGAKVFKVNGDYTQAAKLAMKFHRKKGFYLLGDYLYRREGTKSLGFELAEKIQADYIFSPVGNGTLISAVWKAYKEFKRLGFIKKIPRLVGIQAKGCNPVVRAWETGEEIKPMKGKTIAVAIECGNPLDGKRALLSIQASKGFALDVSDSEILYARELLDKKEGLLSEPAGAVSLAGLLKAKERIPPDSKVVCLVTGHGLKYLKSTNPIIPDAKNL